MKQCFGALKTCQEAADLKREKRSFYGGDIYFSLVWRLRRGTGWGPALAGISCLLQRSCFFAPVLHARASIIRRLREKLKKG